MKRPLHPPTPEELLAAPPFNRRAFFKQSAVSLAGAFSMGQTVRASKSEPAPVIDTNVYLGACPFRHLPMQTTTEDLTSVERFAEAAARHSVASWAGSFEALLLRDFDGINDRLATMASAGKASSRQFTLFGAVNPKIGGWRETLRRIQQTHRMRGIRLHPNYHGYTLSDPDFVALLDAAAEMDLIVQIATRMEDERTQHPAVKVADVDPKPLLETLPQLPGLRIQLLNYLRGGADTLLLARLTVLGVHFDTAMLEGISGIARQIEQAPEIKLCHGSYAPFFYPESSTLKIAESAPDLDARNLAAVSSHHAENLLTKG